MKANDAVETVMKVLNDLRESVDDEQGSLRESHRKNTEWYTKTIGQLSSLA